MIAWLLVWGALQLGWPAAAGQHCADLADQWFVKFQLAREAASEIREPTAAASMPIDLGQAYAEAAAVVVRGYAVALDAYQGALRPAPPEPDDQILKPIAAAAPVPVDLGQAYAGAAAAAAHSYTAALDAYKGALRPPAPPELGDQVLGPFVTAASRQFDLPEPWIQALIRVESNGEVGAVSPKGAMGLTQVMPATYAYLSARYDLGNDPYAPRDNILAGSAYLREMYDRYGPTGFIAAYNAGPGRYDDYLSRRCDLPDETKRYVAAVRLAIGEALFAHPYSRFYQPIAISSQGELLLGKTNQPLPVAERLALHSLVAKAVERANGRN